MRNSVHRVFRVGTRGSALALAQTQTVVGSLKKKFVHFRFEIIVIKTTGDKILATPLSQIGQKGLFIKEIEEALLDKKIDFAVHSLKDLPTELPNGLKIGAVLKREDSHDCLLSLHENSLKRLRKNATVGTSSLRRQAQILWLRPDLRVVNLRGNLDTRIRKLQEGLFDAIVVAYAGVKRLHCERKVRIIKIPCSQILPAAGQGALAIEIRISDKSISPIIQHLHHKESAIQVLAERSFLRVLEGGCQVPIGIVSKIAGKKILLDGMIADTVGARLIRKTFSGPASRAEKIGEELGHLLWNSGGKQILKEIRTQV